MLHTDIPLNPDFSFIKKNFDTVLTKAYKIVSEENEWNAILNYNDLTYISFENKDIVRLMDIIKQECNIYMVDCAWVMLQLEHIAKFGYTVYKDYYIRKVIRNK